MRLLLPYQTAQPDWFQTFQLPGHFPRMPRQIPLVQILPVLASRLLVSSPICVLALAVSSSLFPAGGVAARAAIQEPPCVRLILLSCGAQVWMSLAVGIVW